MTRLQYMIGNGLSAPNGWTAQKHDDGILFSVKEKPYHWNPLSSITIRPEFSRRGYYISHEYNVTEEQVQAIEGYLGQSYQGRDDKGNPIFSE